MKPCKPKEGKKKNEITKKKVLIDLINRLFECKIDNDVYR